MWTSGSGGTPGGADLWFVSASDTGKIEEIERDPHVNLSYFDGKRKQWVNRPRAVIIYELVKGMVTGEKPELGEMRTVHGGDR